jgi:peptide deformylase
VAVQPIRLFGDPVLRTPAERVETFDKELRTLVANLTDSMLDAPGVGLAAPQLGVGLRVFTYHVDDEQAGHVVNPELHFPDDEDQDGPEGCLSIPGVTVDCRRKLHVIAHGQNMYGDPILIEGSGLLARCVQHETDHLDGVLFLDRLDAEMRKIAMKEIRSSEWWAAADPAARPLIKVSPHATGGLAL